VKEQAHEIHQLNYATAANVTSTKKGFSNRLRKQLQREGYGNSTVAEPLKKQSSLPSVTSNPASSIDTKSGNVSVKNLRVESRLLKQLKRAQKASESPQLVGGDGNGLVGSLHQSLQPSQISQISQHQALNSVNDKKNPV